MERLQVLAVAAILLPRKTKPGDVVCVTTDIKYVLTLARYVAGLPGRAMAFRVIVARGLTQKIC